MDGFFYIDKPTGCTSFDVLRDIRRALGIKKLGHTGTLDPLATGGLLVAIGNYTKLISYIDKEQKIYEATMMLDGVSDSYDSDTEISFISQGQQDEFSKTLTKKKIEQIFSENFMGKISQVPPRYSALKIQGKRALERVRAGEEVIMKARSTEIFSYAILEFQYPKLRVKISVKAGTYIRSIAHDLGQIIGSGGYISELRRTGVGTLGSSDMISLEKISFKNTLEIDKVFPKNIIIFQDREVYKRLSNGQRVRHILSAGDGETLFLSDGNMIRYVIEYLDGVMHPRKKII